MLSGPHGNVCSWLHRLLDRARPGRRFPACLLQESRRPRSRGDSASRPRRSASTRAGSAPLPGVSLPCDTTGGRSAPTTRPAIPRRSAVTDSVSGATHGRMRFDAGRSSSALGSSHWSKCLRPGGDAAGSTSSHGSRPPGSSRRVARAAVWRSGAGGHCRSNCITSTGTDATTGSRISSCSVRTATARQIPGVRATRGGDDVRKLRVPPGRFSGCDPRPCDRTPFVVFA